ncbi:MAG: hypothetical protein MRY74_14480 [Neomegalonema sp.]|nr:hypothetical protein [Neomegalonema sp.]
MSWFTKRERDASSGSSDGASSGSTSVLAELRAVYRKAIPDLAHFPALDDRKGTEELIQRVDAAVSELRARGDKLNASGDQRNAEAAYELSDQIKIYLHAISDLAPPPDPDDLNELVKRIEQLGKEAKKLRTRGDEFINSEDADSALLAFGLALQIEERSLDLIRYYSSYDLMFDPEGNPLPLGGKSNYPLEGGEQKLAELFCDRLGRTGGLYRRLGQLEKASQRYEIGKEIEIDGANFQVYNSYNLVNDIIVKIERGLAVAQAVAGERPTVREELETARAIIARQIDGPRKGQAWAKADYAMVMLLLDRTCYESLIEQNYQEFIDVVPTENVEDATVRVLRELHKALEKLGDPTAQDVSWGLNLIAVMVKKKVERRLSEGQ